MSPRLDRSYTVPGNWPNRNRRLRSNPGGDILAYIPDHYALGTDLTLGKGGRLIMSHIQNLTIDISIRRGKSFMKDIENKGF
jgi:hypothetical protein